MFEGQIQFNAPKRDIWNRNKFLPKADQKLLHYMKLKGYLRHMSITSDLIIYFEF